MSMRKRYTVLMSLMLLLVTTPYVLQGQAATCPAIVDQALNALGNNCADLTRNNACYGYKNVSASFFQPQPIDFFTKPSDKAQLVLMKSIQTTAYDATSQGWGIAVLKVQANIPNSVPGQAVTFLLMGDAQVRNAVPADQALTPAQPVTVTVKFATLLHASPSLDSPTLTSVDPGASLAADALSADSAWARVAFQNSPAWISLDALNPNDALNQLPAITADSRTPMQAFYFSTGLGAASCVGAPSTVSVESPENIRIDLTVNGANIEIGSLVSFQSQLDGGMKMIVHHGNVQTDDGQTVRSGETIGASLDSDGNILDWLTPRPATEDELQLGDTVTSALNRVSPPSGANCVGPLTHVVQPGENLFRIALRYNTSIMSIANANGITDVRVIRVGQSLTIPTPCSGFVNDAPQTPPGPPQLTPGSPNNVGSDCASLRPTSPIGHMPNSYLIFYWDGISSATRYVVNIYDGSGGLRRSYSTQGSETNVATQTTYDSIGLGTNFAWDVSAYQGDKLLCTSARIQLVRDPPAPVPTPEP